MIERVSAESEHGKFLNRYALLMGSLICNFQGLEFLLRDFLQKQPGEAPMGLQPDQNLYSPLEGSEVNLCPLTNRDSLGDLIENYNAIASAQKRELVDLTIVDIRDALAHGRVATLESGSPTRLIKYSEPIEPSRKTVRVEFSFVLDEAWFQKQKGRVIVAMGTVNGAPLL